MSLRAKVAVELGTLAILTVVFLALFPKRPPWADVGLAAFALVLIGATARYTRQTIWASLPSKPGENRVMRCIIFAARITLPAVILFFIAGGLIGYRAGGWTGVAARVLNWRILVAFACYVPWALMQQTLFQFYLLGRLAVLFSSVHPLVLSAFTGAAYSLVHLPDLWTTVVTGAAGIVWSYLYFQFRVLWPLSLSHALLGSTFYYWICGHDLVAEWSLGL
jgi:hypothetical protein